MLSLSQVLHLAVLQLSDPRNSLQAIQALLTAGANPNMRSHEGDTALSLALYQQQCEHYHRTGIAFGDADDGSGLMEMLQEVTMAESVMPVLQVVDSVEMNDFALPPCEFATSYDGAVVRYETDAVYFTTECHNVHKLDRKILAVSDDRVWALTNDDYLVHLPCEAELEHESAPVQQQQQGCQRVAVPHDSYRIAQYLVSSTSDGFPVVVVTRDKIRVCWKDIVEAFTPESLEVPYPKEASIDSSGRYIALLGNMCREVAVVSIKRGSYKPVARMSAPLHTTTICLLSATEVAAFSEVQECVEVVHHLAICSAPSTPGVSDEIHRVNVTLLGSLVTKRVSGNMLIIADRLRVVMVSIDTRELIKVIAVPQGHMLMDISGDLRTAITLSDGAVHRCRGLIPAADSVWSLADAAPRDKRGRTARVLMLLLLANRFCDVSPLSWLPHDVLMLVMRCVAPQLQPVVVPYADHIYPPL
eukprot:TRINITY_DN2573_c5_g1_i4.p1 TRINITY_DN2573_c5_g1~~TRINITY_DN2573_c5_g1_i4.p1  ORF type:complete len:473 (+),score=107.18 TRINITY_DN2573_c5_g1_i4:613-2031(+)